MILVKTPCLGCKEENENWACLTCGGVYCSRYIKGDMKKHSDESGHLLCISLMDLSVWCYGCGDYIDNHDTDLKTVKNLFEKTKFPPDDPNVDEKINEAISKIYNEFHK